MNMKNMIQKMTLLESEQTNECGMDEGPMAMPAMPPKDDGDPVSMNVSINARGKEHVADLIDMMKNAGMTDAKPVSQDMMPVRTDIERLRDIVDGPKMKLPAPEEAEMEDEDLEEYENEPEEKYGDTKMMTKDLAGGINREKKAYKAAQDGDNAMAVESEIYNALKAQYAELKKD